MTCDSDGDVMEFPTKAENKFHSEMNALYEEAYDAFFKATWTNEQQEMSFYFLAAIASMKKDYLSALELCGKRTGQKQS